jgi:SOS-response transcriptional repressor LexA/DNA-binding XRE family transcriptional regulator
MHTDPHVLGQRIAGLRHAHGWSQRRLAEVAGVSHGYVALLELGRLPSPGKFRLDAIARALDLRTSDALLAPLAPLPPQPDVSAASDHAAPRTLEERIQAASSASAVAAASSSSWLRGSGLDAQSQPGRDSLAVAASVPASFRASVRDRDGVDHEGDNVLGALEQLRPRGARPLPVFRWGSCGDPRDRESPPDPDHLEFPPPGRETLIGPNGFGVVVKGESMAGRGIFDGDVVWVNPERPYQLGKVVLALVTDVGGDSGMVVKTYARSDVGECLMSESVQGRSPVVCQEFKVIGPVVGITSWRLPTTTT